MNVAYTASIMMQASVHCVKIGQIRWCWTPLASHIWMNAKGHIKLSYNSFFLFPKLLAKFSEILIEKLKIRKFWVKKYLF